MSTIAGYELTVFGGAAACGLVLAFLYDLFRIKRRFVRTSVVFIHIEDILFWIIAAIIVFLASYVISSGETRFYFFTGLCAGAFAYFALLSRIVSWTLTEIIKAVLWPFRQILRRLAPVFRVFLRHTRKGLGKFRNQVAVRAYRIRVDMRRLRNAMTKK